ncbi:uncharacterized protein [Centroberyx affinis]|uniref:uncharacterized protein n=1 Tax=Centroberyx affinis TaxID=166261 RepID=UPI003A5BBC57
MPLPLVAIGVGASVVGAAAGVGGEVAQLLPTHRQCAIEITNGCSQHTLCNPRMFINRGRCSVPLSPTVDPSTSESALFTKTPHTARGSVGVFTYDLLNNRTKQATKKMAVMFNVPYDFNLYSNCYAVGIFDMSKKCDYNLYHDMHKKKVNGFVRGDPKADCSLTHKSHGVTIRASMSDAYQPVMKVQVSDKE